MEQGQQAAGIVAELSRVSARSERLPTQGQQMTKVAPG